MLEVTTLRRALTIGLILGLLALDLALAAARPHAVGLREAAISSAFYIAVAILFGVFTAQVVGEVGAQYFAGYLVEKSLSVDNLFVFVIITLAFIGLKLVLHWGHGITDRVPEVSTNLSLAVIVAALTVTTVASRVKVRRHPETRAHAGSLSGSTSADLL